MRQTFDRTTGWGNVASARDVLARTLRPVSIVIGLMVSRTVDFVLKFGAAAVIWYAHQPAAGLLYWSLALVAVVVSVGSGGYVAARLSGRRGFVAAIAVGVVELLSTLPALLAGWSGWWSWWMSAIYVLLIVPAAALGGWLVVRGREESVFGRIATPASFDPTQP